MKILELDENKARINLPEQGHTFMNALVEELLRDPGVDVARYIVEFNFSATELLVTTEGDRNPIDAIKDCCVRLTGYCDELIAQIENSPQN